MGLFKSTIDSVLSDISSKIGKLRDLAEKHDVLAGKHAVWAQEHQFSSNDHLEGRDRATRIAIKLEELLK